MAACYFAAGADCAFDSGATAAWMQAIGSVLAILVSAAFAIVVPHYVRDLEEKAAAQRALLSCIYLVDLISSSFESLHRLLESNSFHERSRDIFDGERALTERALEQIELSRLGPNALNVLRRADGFKIVLAAMVDIAANSGFEEDPLANIAGVQADLHELADELSPMFPMKLRGHWIGDNEEFRKYAREANKAAAAKRSGS